MSNKSSRLHKPVVTDRAAEFELFSQHLQTLGLEECTGRQRATRIWHTDPNRLWRSWRSVRIRPTVVR
jgi:hypothetical protein